MLCSYSNEKLLGLQGVEIKKIKENEGQMWIDIEMPREECVCPRCGRTTSHIHDYRVQPVKDISAFGKKVILNLRKRRYACSCGKRFIEPNSFLPKYQRMTQRAVLSLLNCLASVHSYTDTAKAYDVSPSTVIRYFRKIQYTKPLKLPEVIGIDEFKGNTGGEKFHAILTDIKDRKVIDILKTRKEVDLCQYFKEYDRKNVKYFVSDMYKPYAEIAATYFPDAIYVIDRYHWIRQMTWAFEAIRKEVQKRFSKQHRIYFKHSKGLLLRHEEDLDADQHRQVYIMLDLDPNLSTAYFLKEQLYKILKQTNPDKQKQMFSDWIEEAEESKIPAIMKCAKTYRSWFNPICNSFYCPYTNGFTEGCNNKIKVLKRNAYGLHNFKSFRNRILFMFSKPTLTVATAQHADA